MKLLSAKQIAQLDKITIENEPITSVDLMERAALKIVNQLFKIPQFSQDYKSVDFTGNIKIFCGSGNNGGDGFAIANHLLSKGFKVEVFWVQFSANFSEDAEYNYQLLIDDQIEILNINNENYSEIEIGEFDLVIDSIFGSGLNRPIDGFVAEIIQKINNSQAKVIAVDIPSGLFAYDNSNNILENIIRADITFTFQMPKVAFLQPQNNLFTGSWHVLDIGLLVDSSSDFITKNYWVNKQFVEGLLPPRKTFSHKGSYGHALLIGGSFGKMGSISLATKACLKSGVGLATACVPNCGIDILQTVIPEAMVLPNEGELYLEGNVALTNKTSIGIGVGAGTEEKTAQLLKNLIAEANAPLVIDADGINILSENKTWLAFLPPQTILTPHPKEFERLVGPWETDEEKLKLLKGFCAKFNSIVVLKGAFTVTCTPNGNLFYNSTGNAGMATAGSGDVLFGIICGYLAQGLQPVNAVVLAVFNHGLAADIMVKETSETSLIASDIIEGLNYVA